MRTIKLAMSFLASVAFLSSFGADIEKCTAVSADGMVNVDVFINAKGQPVYTVKYDGKEFIKESRLGLRTDIADFSENMSIVGESHSKAEVNYKLRQSKFSDVHKGGNTMLLTMQNKDKKEIKVFFYVSDNDIAFRYILEPQKGNSAKCATVSSEATSFNFAQGTTTFLSPQSLPLKGWARTKPSYEEEYKVDQPMDVKSDFGVGYTFPCLFKVGNDGWVLVSETGLSGSDIHPVDKQGEDAGVFEHFSSYCASRLSDYNPATGYTVSYPQEGENNGNGTPFAALSLPGYTPWRTITLGKNLAPIVETTIPFDVVSQVIDNNGGYKPGRYTWSWLIGQDNATVYSEQVRFIDLASAMGYEYCLVDALWDTQIGREKMEELSRYAQSKNVSLMLWYNSNGSANDAFQGPRNAMNSSLARHKEMAWMKANGIKGIKVDFFGGDKQETIRLYEDILADAAEYGIQVIFHGCTLPRGWERMYPNYVASEAALASENVFFSEHHAEQEGFQLSMHPFCRNAVGAFDWGGVIMNKYMSTDNKSRHRRHTSDVFEIASGVVIQSSIQCVCLQPNNLDELPDFELNALRQLPTEWDETRYIDGYPSKYAVIARRSGSKWYVGGINGSDKEINLSLDLSFIAGKNVALISDKKLQGGQLHPEAVSKDLKVSKNGKVKVCIRPMGGIYIYEK